MKYYKDDKGICNRCDDKMNIKDCTVIDKAEYDLYIASLPVITPVKSLSELLKEKGIISSSEFNEVNRDPEKNP